MTVRQDYNYFNQLVIQASNIAIGKGACNNKFIQKEKEEKNYLSEWYKIFNGCRIAIRVMEILLVVGRFYEQKLSPSRHSSTLKKVTLVVEMDQVYWTGQHLFSSQPVSLFSFFQPLTQFLNFKLGLHQPLLL